MKTENHNSTTRYKVVHRTINGCPVSIWADTQQRTAPDPAVLRHLMVAFEDRLMHKQAKQ